MKEHLFFHQWNVLQAVRDQYVSAVDQVHRSHVQIPVLSAHLARSQVRAFLGSERHGRMRGWARTYDGDGDDCVCFTQGFWYFEKGSLWVHTEGMMIRG